jgi:hypothetical protein
MAVRFLPIESAFIASSCHLRGEFAVRNAAVKENGEVGGTAAADGIQGYVTRPPSPLNN